MCGIVGAIAARNIVPVLVEGLRRLEYRGYDSAGVAVIDDNKKIGLCRAVGKVAELDALDLLVVGGPETLIDALLETVGPEGTIMMNTFTEFFYPTEVELEMVDYVFDVESTGANTGIIPETFRKRDDGVRSRHPTFSVAAIGKMAEFLTEGHDETADAYLPFSKLSEINGKYLAIGIGDRLVGFRHQAQHLAGLLDVVPWRRCVRYKTRGGEIKIFTLKDRGGCVKRLSELVSHLRKIGLVRDGKIGMASAVLVSAKESLAVMAELLIHNPSINLCDSVWCLWCR